MGFALVVRQALGKQVRMQQAAIIRAWRGETALVPICHAVHVQLGVAWRGVAAGPGRVNWQRRVEVVDAGRQA
jgi:hypothetical protein